MYRKFLIVSILLLSIIAAKAQESNAQTGKLRVAVFDPTSSSTTIDEGTRDAVRELISSTFVNTGRYIIVERSLLQQVIKEQKLSNTDAFDESQATELGRLAGANKVVLSVVSLVGGRNMLSIKLIDVNTATIDQQKTRIVGSNDLLDAVEPLTLNMLGVKTLGDALDKNVNDKPDRNQRTVNIPIPRNSNDNPIRNNDSRTVYACGIEIQANDLYNKKVGLGEIVLPDGWRLPTREELRSMCEEQKNIGNFNSNAFSYYFTSEFDKKGKVYTRSFDDCKENTGDPDSEKAWVRCVRDR